MSRERRRVIFSGYFGCGNAGDEAVLAAAVSLLREMRPEVEIYALSGAPARTERLHGIKAVPRTALQQIWRLFTHSDLLISGGGSLLQDATSLRSPLYYLGVMALALTAGLPVVVYAQGVGPLRSRVVRGLTRFALERAARVSVRDADSRRLLAELGVDREIAVTADPVFAFTPGARRDRETEGRSEHSGDDKLTVGIAPRRWGGSGVQQVLVDYAHRLLARRKGELELRLIAMHLPGDRELCRAIREDVAQGPAAGGEFPKAGGCVKVVAPGGAVRSLDSAFADLDLLVGMRLHALIFALRRGIPVLAISYDPKVASLLVRYGLEPVGEVGKIDPERLFSCTERIVDAPDRFENGLVETSRRMGELAREDIRAIVGHFLS